MPKPDLVIGGAGFIGSNLVKALVARPNHDGGDAAARRVIVADNLCAAHSLWLLGDVRDRIDYFHADIRCPEDLARLPRTEYRRIYHLAASFANELSVEHPTLDARTNADGTANVVALARARGCELLVYTGSSSSYGDAPVPMVEDGPMQPQTQYASNKLLGERYVEDSGLPWAVLRLFNVYGPGEAPGRYRNAIPNMMKALDGEGSLVLFGDGATRDFSYVDDVVEVLLRAERFQGHAVNVGTGEETRIVDLAQEILGLLGAPDHRIRREPRRGWDRIQRRCADTRRLQQLGGLRRLTPWRDGLRATAQWLFDHGLIERPPRAMG